MYNKYDKKDNGNTMTSGIVLEATGENIRVFSDIENLNIKQSYPYGYFATPTVDDRALILHTNENEYLFAGVIKDDVPLNPGEILLRAGSGAYIRFRYDGKIEINGKIINTLGEFE